MLCAMYLADVLQLYKYSSIQGKHAAFCLGNDLYTMELEMSTEPRASILDNSLYTVNVEGSMLDMQGSTPYARILAKSSNSSHSL